MWWCVLMPFILLRFLIVIEMLNDFHYTRGENMQVINQTSNKVFMKCILRFFKLLFML